MTNKYYNILLNLAKKAKANDEVPVSALIIKNNKIISKNYNKNYNKKNSLLHAEILVINKACKKLNKSNLNDCELYVTLKPCSMCEGAIKQAKIKKVHYILEKNVEKKEYYKTIWQETNNSTQKEMYSSILRDFFQNKRDKKH